ncbi:MAG: DUF58 domain-containing protein [Gemmatimonadales bacterium]|nr:MAG: DUF58 domain-containing protein [Gemmatimonadales bacterium]
MPRRMGAEAMEVGAMASGAPRVPGRWSVDPRLPAWVVAGFGGLLAAVATGRWEFAVLGTPFLVLGALGLVGRRPPLVEGRVEVSSTRILEGDVLEGALLLDWDGEAQVDAVLSGIRGLEQVEPVGAAAWSLPAGEGPVRLRFRLEGRAWGTHDTGTPRVRIRRPGGLVVREVRMRPGPRVKVLPGARRLDQLLRPAEPRAVSGVHVSRRRGEGSDFAELRPYQPGDRLRDLSWGTSARLGEPWVTVHHPERMGTVLLLLDSFVAEGEAYTETLSRAARAAWAVASVHLQARDRVGLLVGGRTPAWVPPGGGRRARWMLLEELLAVGAAAQDRTRQSRSTNQRSLPSDALVVGITSLQSRDFVRELVAHRRSGRAAAALVLDLADLVEEGAGVGGAGAGGRGAGASGPGASGPAGATVTDAGGGVAAGPGAEPAPAAAAPSPADPAFAAFRLWMARRDIELRTLERAGVRTAVVREEEGVAPAIAHLRRRMNPRRMGIRGGAGRSA